MEFSLVHNWMYAWDGIWRIPWNFLRMTLAGRCGYWKRTLAWKYGGVVDWKLLNGSQMGNTDEFFVGNSGRPPGWSNRMESWSENMKVN